MVRVAPDPTVRVESVVPVSSHGKWSVSYPGGMVQFYQPEFLHPFSASACKSFHRHRRQKSHRPGVLVRSICDTCAICHNIGISIYPGFKAAANGRSIFFSGLGRGVHGAAADQSNLPPLDRSIVFWGILAADARSQTAGGRYRTAADGDLATGGAESAVTNARCAVCASCRLCRRRW